LKSVWWISCVFVRFNRRLRYSNETRISYWPIWLRYRGCSSLVRPRLELRQDRRLGTHRFRTVDSPVFSLWTDAAVPEHARRRSDADHRKRGCEDHAFQLSYGVASPAMSDCRKTERFWSPYLLARRLFVFLPGCGRIPVSRQQPTDTLWNRFSRAASTSSTNLWPLHSQMKLCSRSQSARIGLRQNAN